jgi:single-strand DNA-binding protein
MLLGHLGKDPEVRYFENHKVVATFSLATSEIFIDKNGEKKTDTEWHNIEMWDNLAKAAEKFLKKGNQVFIEGKIKTDSWRDKEGNEKTGKKIKATSMTLVGSGASREHGAGKTENPAQVNSVGPLNELPF